VVAKKEFNIDNESIENYLLECSKKYLKIIFYEYGSFMSLEQLGFLKQLLSSNCIEVNSNLDNYLANQIDAINKDPDLSFYEKQKEIENLNVPLAHGGRVFEDNKIHFYPFVLFSNNDDLSFDELRQKCEEVLIHELLHFFIRPLYLDTKNNPELKRINSFTTEGLVDMCARDLQQKYGFFPNYNSEYGSNVIFMRETLANISDYDEKMKLIFGGSIEQIYNKTSNENYNSQEQFINAKNKKTKYDKLITNISKICGGADSSKDYERKLYNFSANYKNKEDSLDAIFKISHIQFPDKINLIKDEITNYKLDNKNLNSEKIFAQRNEKEKQMEKPKVRVRTNDNVNSFNKGYVNVIILSLIIFLVIIITFLVL